MPFEELEKLAPNFSDAGAVLDAARQTISDCAGDAWADITSNDVVANSMASIQDAADAAWETCSPSIETASEAISNGMRNGAYFGGRFALGVADVGENAYIGVRSNIELAISDEKAAVQTAQIHVIDSAADSWGDHMGADEQMREIGDVAEAGGEIATEIALGAAAVTASAPAAAVAGGALVLDEMGKSLENSSADGDISQEEVVDEVVVGAVTAGTLVAGRGLNNFLASKASDVGKAGCLVDDAGRVVDDFDSLTPNSNYFLDGVKCSTDDVGRVFRIGDDLAPNANYELNGYRYTTDAKGRIESAEGVLQTKTHDGRLVIQDSMQAIGRGSQKAFDQRGHLIADRFNGSAGMENIVAMGEEVNQKTYAAIESKCADALEDGAEVFFRVESLYDKSSYRPESFIVTDIIDGEETVTILRNTARG